MKIKKLLPSLLAILGVLIVMASCEEDFNTLGSEVIDQNIEIPDTVFDVVSYSRKLPPIRTNGLPTNQLGIYNDPNYGTMRVNLLGQVLLPQGLQNPDFPNDGPNADTGDPGDEFEISKVYLHIPFFNQSTTDGDGETSFTLDSVYGSQPMNITFYRSNYLLRDLDPGSNFEDPQPYYSNQTPLFERFLNDELGRLEDFVPSNEAIEIFTATDTINYEPGLLVEFNPDYFKENIIEINTILRLTPNHEVKNKMLTEINYTALVSIDNLQDKEEMEKIVLVKVPTEVYPSLYETFIYLFKQAGIKEVDIVKDVNFEKLFNERKAS